MGTFSRFCTICVTCWSVSVATADKKLQSETLPRYANQWAIVIGINYDGRNDMASAGVQPLKNAEADADAVATALVENFGYRDTGSDRTLYLLKGPQATKREIERLFGKAFLKDTDHVSKNDSVLVFFAGHGDREKRENLSQTLVYPYDVQAVEGKGIDDTSCISIGFLLEQFRFCEARHKLLILDSCHSGEIFRFQTRTGARHDLDADLFNAQVTQALTASAGDQSAQDGERHSPFTEALLEALNGTSVKSRIFGASVLMSSIPERVQQLNQQRGVPTRQTPRGGPLDGDGEFYFFRTSELLPAASDSMDPRQLALQTMPGLSGEWWFDETPWLVPALRSERSVVDALPVSVTALKPIDGQVPSAESSFLETSDVAALRNVLRGSAETYINRRPREERMALGALLQLTSEELNEEQISRLIELFDSYPDSHLRAAVHQRLNRDDTETLYKAALDEYENGTTRTRGDANVRQDGLLRLCWSDYGQYLLNAGKTLEARTAIRNALSFNADDRPPTLFVINNLLTRARAESMAGEWQVAEKSLQTAEVTADALPPSHPMRATIHDRYAWMEMDRWKLNEARTHFLAALEIRRHLSTFDLTTQVRILHNEHGLAMVDRFSGRLSDARDRYERLTTEARGLLRQTGSRFESELVYGRIANSLERLSDCYLFATPSEPVIAYETIDRAVQLSSGLSLQQHARTQARLSCKAAMAMAMAGEPQQALEHLARIRETDYKQLVGNQIHEMDVYWNLGDGVARLKLDAVNGRSPLRSAIDAAMASSQGLAAGRQQWEIALCASDLLVHSHGAEVTVERQRDADRLLQLAAGGFLNASNLPYLRPYLDTALRVRFQSPDTLRLRSLADIAVRAKSGRATDELPRDRSSVVFHLFRQDGYVLVLPGRDATSQAKAAVIPLSFGSENFSGESLPTEVTKACEQLPLPVDTYWSDMATATPVTNERFPFADPTKWTLKDVVGLQATD